MLRVILAALAAGGALTGQSVDGHVVNAATGADIAGVRVALLQDGKMVYSAATDSEGRFRIEDVKSGAYSVMYRARGFFAFPDVFDGPSQARVLVADKEVHLDRKLRPVPKISGHVSDANDKPIPGAKLWVLQNRFGCGTPTCFATLQKIESGSKGEFSSGNLEALPGTWILSATAPPEWDAPEARDGQRLGWATTLYPGVTDPQLAQKIDPGNELWALDVKLAAVPVHRVRGRILDPHGDPAPKASLILGNGVGPALQATTKDDGTFEFAAVPDGDWRLSARMDQDGARLWAARWIEIQRRDADEIELRLTRPFSLHGTIAAQVPDGVTAPRLSEAPDVVLDYEGNDQMEDTPRTVGHRTDGLEFEVRAVYPGSYRVMILGSPPAGYFLDSILAGGEDALRSTVQLQSDAQELTITYKYGGGTVRGTIEDCGTGMVMLMPVDRGLRYRWEIVRDTSCGANGQFEIGGVRPGEYYGIAVTASHAVSLYQALQYEDLLNRRAARVSVRAGEITNAEIRMLW